YHVTIDGKTYPLERPFFTMATQNPIESEGTYALPEAQLDRFMFKLLIHYPPENHEEKIMALSIRAAESPEAVLATLQPVLDVDQLSWIRSQIESILVESHIVHYASQLVRQTRAWKDVYHGASPRAGITLLRGA